MSAPFDDPARLCEWIDTNYKDLMLEKLAAGIKKKLGKRPDLDLLAKELYSHLLERACKDTVRAALARQSTLTGQINYLAGVAFNVGREQADRFLTKPGTVQLSTAHLQMHARSQFVDPKQLERQAIIHSGLAQLDPRDRRIYKLVVERGLQIASVARILTNEARPGAPPVSVDEIRRRFDRAEQFLHEYCHSQDES